MKTIEDAMNTAIMGHYGQKNRSDGSPYIYHPFHVMNMMELDDLDGRKVAVLHDVVEDTEVTLHYLQAMGFAEDIVEAVDAISRRKNEPLDEYLTRLIWNELARRVKKKDAQHNLERSQRDLENSVGDIKKLKRAQGRIDKYKRTIFYLEHGRFE